MLMKKLLKRKSQNKIFSIIVTFYNDKEYIEGCLQRLANQSSNVLPYMEIIVVDNNSKEAETKFLKKCIKKFKKYMDIYYVFGDEFQSCGYARNVGLEQATGEYVYFLDCDDVITADAFQEFYNAYSAIKEVGIQYYPYIQATQHWIKQDGVFHIVNTSQHYIDVSIHSKMFSKALLDTYNIRFPVRYYHEDRVLMYEVMEIIYSNKDLHIFTIEKPLYYYIERPNSILTTKNNFSKETQNLKDMLQAGNDYVLFCQQWQLGLNLGHIVEIIAFATTMLSQYQGNIDVLDKEILQLLIAVNKYFNISLDNILTDVAKINECSKDEVKQLFYKMYKRTE